MRIANHTESVDETHSEPLEKPDAPAISRSRRPLVSGAGLVFGLTRPSILVLLCVGAVMHLGVAFSQAAARLHQWDFSHYYVAAFAMRAGLNPYATDLRPLGDQLGLEGIARATDTPFFLLCFEPLTRLSPTTAYWIWCAVNAGALIAVIALILYPAQRIYKRRPSSSRLTGRQAISLCALVSLYPPLSNHIFFAQTQIVVLLLLMIAMLALQARFDRVTGLVIAIASLLKVFPIVIAGYFIVRRRWRALGWTIAGLVIGTVVTLFAFGIARNESFIGATYFTRRPGFLARPANVALGSFISRMFWYAAGDLRISSWLDWARILAVSVGEIALLGLTVIASVCRVKEEREPSKAARKNEAPDRPNGYEERVYALWVVAAIMLSPTAWIHYMVLLILPMMLIAIAGWEGCANSRSLWLIAASYAVISLSMAISGGAHDLLVQRPYLKTALEECAALSLMLAYASAWYFAAEIPI